jgi:hypothetical protein
MTNEHPDAPKQFGIRLNQETMELVSEIQEFRQRTNQPTTLASIVEDAICIYYDRLVDEGAIYGHQLTTKDSESFWTPSLQRNMIPTST